MTAPRRRFPRPGSYVLAVLLLAACASDVRAPVPGDPLPPAEAAAAAPTGGDVLVGAGGTLYVVARLHPAASDDGPGTAERPWRTIARAARQMRPGDAVRIHGGIYRETVAPPRGGTGGDARITYAAAPHETVVVTGADHVADGWQRIAPGRWRRAWTFGPMPTYTDDPVFRRELAIGGHRVLRPVGAADDLAPGTMHVAGPDTAPTGITVELDGGPPDIEIATRERLFWPVGATPFVPCGDASMPSWIRVVGITFRHAANRAQWGAVCAGAAHGLWEDVTVEWTIGLGVDTSGRDHVFRRVTSRDHGQMGWGGQSERLLLEDTRSERNNWRGHDPFWEAGGGKWLHTRESVFRRHAAIGNFGPGLWLDTDNHANTVEGGRFVGNEVAGIMLELNTTRTLVQHSVITGTRWRAWSGAGILSQAASDNLILHNTVVGNAGSGVWLRRDPERRAPDERTVVAANWIVGNVTGATEARELSVEADSRAGLASHRFADNGVGRHAGDPLWRSSFFAVALDGSADVRTHEADAWRRWVSDRGTRVVRAGDAPFAVGPATGPAADLRGYGASAAPARPWTHAGANPSRVAGG